MTDKLDGIKSAKKRMESHHHHQPDTPQSIEEWLQLSKDLDRKVTKPGKKRVSTFFVKVFLKFRILTIFSRGFALKC